MRTTLWIPSIVGVWLVVGTTLASRVDGEDRADIPDARTFDAAARTVDDAFDIEQASKDPARRLELAHKLIDAQKSGKDPIAVRYLELCRARDLACTVDLQTAMAASDQLVKSFDLDAGKERLGLLASRTARPTTPSVETIVSWSDEAVTAGRLDQARRLADAAVSLAVPLRSPLLANDAREQLMRVTKAEKDERMISGLRARLNARPEDAEARFQLGRLLCVDQDKWAEGLSLLQKTPDVWLRAAVQLEMSNPSTSADILAAGDAWWELAHADRTFPSAAAQRRAVMWYERAVPQLDGLLKTRVEGRLDQAAGGDQGLHIDGRGKWVTLALSGTKWGLAPHSLIIDRRGCSLVIRNADPGLLYLVNDRIIPAGFAIDVTVKGHCIIGLLSADRVDQSLYCTVPGDGAWHEVRLQREGQIVAAFQDGDASEVKSYNARALMPGVVGFQLSAGQLIELRSISLR